MQCYTSNSSAILEKSNAIMEKLGHQIYKKNDMFSLKFLSLILNILTNGSFPISESLSEIIQNCENLKLNCPIFINENSLKSQNSYIFLIQIQIIFDVFSEKIEQILTSDRILKSNPENEKNIINNDVEQIQSQIDDKIQKNENNKKEETSDFQDKSYTLNNTEKIEKEQASKIINNDNNDQPNNRQRKISSAFQDELNIFNSNEQDTDIKNVEKVPSMSNISINQESNNQEDKNDQDQQNNSKQRKISSAFQEKIGILNSNEPNKEIQGHKIHFNPDMQKESSNFNNEKETLNNSDSKEDNIDQPHNDKISRLSNLLRYELNLFDNENDNENSTERYYDTSIDEIQQNIAAPPPPKKIQNQSTGSNKMGQLFGDMVKSSKSTDNANVSTKLPSIDVIQKLLSGSDEKLQNASQIIKPVLKENIKKMAKLWNPPNPELIFDDGILYEDKSASQTPKSETQTQNKISHETNSKVRLYNNFFQIFKYDESDYNWFFCELNFEQMIMNLNPNKITPLILFIDSKTEDVLNFVKYFKSEFNFGGDENISVFAFQKKPTKYFPDAINKDDIQFDEPFFMFVHVPLYKQNDPQIGTILYQIYTFLFMISDLNVVLFDKKHKMDQILFIKNLISITKIYTEDKERIFRKESDILFLYKMKPKNIEKDSEINIQDKLNKLKQKIEPHIFKFQLNCINNASEFTEIFEKIVLNQCNQFSDVKRLMNIANSSFSQINSMYLQLRCKNNIYIELNNVILNMFTLVEGNTLEIKIENLRNEIKAFYPPNDEKFSRFIDLILTNLLIDTSKEISNTINNKLKSISDTLLPSLEKKINENNHLTEVQMNLIERGHIYNLKKEFFNIVRDVSQNKYLEYYYNKYLEILNQKISDDKCQIRKYFNSFRANLKKKETVIEQKYDESVMKGTNYVMRETQKTREIEVIVAEDGDINTKIEPDF